MAYISTQQVKEIRETLKKTLTTKDGFKLSVKTRHYSTVCVTVLSAPFELDNGDERLERDGYASVNEFYLHKIEDKMTRTVFEIIDKTVNRITGGNFDRNAGDHFADYSNFNFHKSYSIGEWNKPFKASK